MRFLRVAAAVLAFASAGAGWAQQWPSKPITFIVPYAAGGPTDVVARTIGVGMSRALNNASIVIENKVGAGGTIAVTHVAKAAPDGYTFLVQTMRGRRLSTLRVMAPEPEEEDEQEEGREESRNPLLLLGSLAAGA